jgi:ABC-type nitrate/sulfonate/bicarbonate transport system permease component
MVTKPQKRLLRIFWLVVAFFFWQFWPGYLIPRPEETFEELLRLYERGLSIELWVSLWVIIRAGIFISFPLGCILTYLYTAEFWKPPILFIASLRNIGMNTLVAAFIMMSLGGDTLKVITMSFVMTVYFVSSTIQRIDSFSQDFVNHGITMRQSRWQILWHRVIRGSFYLFCYDFIPCLGMGWSMLSFVEGLARNEGGMGDIMLQVDKINSYAGILALAIVGGTFGMGMWYGLRFLIRSISKFASQKSVKA